MQEIIRMIVVLTLLSGISGGLLAAVRDGTAERIEVQQLNFVKGPAIKAILAAATNDPIANRFKLKRGEAEQNFFVGVIDGAPKTVAFESFGKGFGGDIGVMVGVNLEDGKILGVGVTTHSETPGLGARAKTDAKFVSQFKGLTLGEAVKVKNDGGTIDALSGATVTTKGVCAAVTEAGAVYKELKTKIAEQAKPFGK
jgi:electron transport complex protein RnfG